MKSTESRVPPTFAGQNHGIAHDARISLSVRRLRSAHGKTICGKRTSTARAKIARLVRVCRHSAVSRISGKTRGYTITSTIRRKIGAQPGKRMSPARAGENPRLRKIFAGAQTAHDRKLRHHDAR
jgi:hypothetical protein